MTVPTRTRRGGGRRPGRPTCQWTPGAPRTRRSPRTTSRSTSFRPRTSKSSGRVGRASNLSGPLTPGLFPSVIVSGVSFTFRLGVEQIRERESRSLNSLTSLDPSRPGATLVLPSGTSNPPKTTRTFPEETWWDSLDSTRIWSTNSGVVLGYRVFLGVGIGTLLNLVMSQG